MVKILSSIGASKVKRPAWGNTGLFGEGILLLSVIAN